MSLLNLRHCVRALVALALVVPGAAAVAASTWNFSSCNSNSANSSTGGTAAFGNSWNCTGSNGGGTVAVTGWSTTGSGTTYQTAYVSPQGSSGFGVANQGEGLTATSPNHAADNAGYTDLFALNFGTKVVDLTGVTIGWWQTDADVSVLRYTGNNPPAIAGQSIAGLLSGGWKLVGNYADLSTGVTRGVNTADGNVGVNDGASSWWLVSAYNASYGGSSFSAGNDYFKLLSVAGNVAPPPSNGVPEPASLALVGLVMLGAAGGFRRKRKAASAVASPA